METENTNIEAAFFELRAISEKIKAEEIKINRYTIKSVRFTQKDVDYMLAIKRDNEQIQEKIDELAKDFHEKAEKLKNIFKLISGGSSIKDFVFVNQKGDQFSIDGDKFKINGVPIIYKNYNGLNFVVC